MRHFFSRNLALLTLMAAVGVLFYPPLFLIFKDYFLGLFAATMFALGLVMRPEEAREALSKPIAVFIGVSVQYSVMPVMGLVAAMIATWQGASPAMALGFIIVGCAPGAMASNVICYLLGGAVAFSIAMTMVAIMLSPFLTPTLVEWLGGLCKFERRYRVTLAFEIGMQNAGLGVALALKHFEPETALAGALFAVWCILTAAGLSRVRRGKETDLAAAT
ncbi:MAG: bile acid:sodium symporter family protein [Mariprofundus sp.]